ncbi:ROK family transcriptional regulator [Halobacillus salinarum]|uniref:ROK family transcriptional regulator n=1 Tax=Halobacillus salinarum TaxID=2932257 RepID=A0ABY4ENC1_9BACI|nr:ROK family transcriptional regulator [Halobacillus salinarum]UOQ45571.1 ROK family transcriptional regulator [Halobacillus salinarum]
MSTGDATYIKALNKRILIEKMIEHRSISRIELSRLTGLNRSTVSAQINQMMEDKLVIEHHSDVSRGGRKAILLQMNEEAGFTIGIDLDFPQTQVQVTNLLGKPILTKRFTIDEASMAQSEQRLIEIIREVVDEYSKRYTPVGLAGIGIGVHGIVDNENHIVFTPKQERMEINLQAAMESEFHVPVSIDNNANLSVYAEKVYNYPISDLFSITMYSGIGLGIVEDHRIYRGFQGFAGELGHMIVEPNGLPCACGNLGCWELYTSEKSLLKQLNAAGVKVDEIEELDFSYIREEFPEFIRQFLDYLAIGINNVINIFNPQMIILNSQFLHMNQELLEEVKKRLTSRMNHYDQIVSSSLGKEACSLGGAMIALKSYYGVKTLNLSAFEYFQEKETSQP